MDNILDDMEDKDMGERIRKLSESVALTPASKNMFDLITEITTESVATDIVEASTEELYRFSSYWKEMTHNKDTVKQKLIPADIIIEKTVPITDMIISTENNVNYRITISLPPIDIKEYYMTHGADDEFYSVLIGTFTILDTGITFPITVDMKTEAIGISGEIAYINMTYNRFKALTPKIESMLKNKQLIEYIICMIGMILPAWYGIQLALLHPVTKQIFAHPLKEKRDRKDRLKPTSCGKNQKPKSVKYIKRHIITEDNNVHTAIDSAIDDLNKTLSSDGEKRTYERHTALWRVIGHHRTLPSGKVIWIAPYWKGMLKDMASMTANNRIVDIPDKL